MKLSVVMCVRNEEKNLDECLKLVEGIANEIVVVDEKSVDKSVEIAKRYSAKIIEVKHLDNFHINKQKAINAATGDWILQLDADERVSSKLAIEIKEIVSITNNQIVKDIFKKKSRENFLKYELFLRHQKLIEEREGRLGKNTGELVAFFVPRKNFFLGKPLIHAGVYPDGVIRLFLRDRARLPGKSVHELMEVDGEVGWLFNDLEHHESPTLSRYLERMNRYTDLHAEELKEKKVPANILYLFVYSFISYIIFTFPLSSKTNSPKTGYVLINLFAQIANI